MSDKIVNVVETKVGKKKRPLIWRVVVVIVALICVLALTVIVFTQPLAEVKLILHNTEERYDTVRVGIYFDGELKEIVLIEYQGNYTHIYKLARGTHTVGFDYRYDGDLDGNVDLQRSIELTILNPRTIGFTFGPILRFEY